MTKKQKKMLYRILLAAALLLAAVIVSDIPELHVDGWLKLVVFLIPYAVIGWDVLFDAFSKVCHGQLFDEEFLMTIATIGAIGSGIYNQVVKGSGSYDEAVFVMLFYQVGELFQSYAVGKSRKSISSLMDIRPDFANVERNGSVEEVDPEEVTIDEVVVVRPGEKVPLDGMVLEGRSTLNTAALTGESVPRDVAPGSEVISGCVNESGLLRVRVTKEFSQSTVARILDLVENSSSKKAKAENFITKFSRYYTPGVTIAAVLLFLIPSLITGDWGTWLNRALIFLVVSCPCALVISIPMSFFGGIGGASKEGILVKGGNYLELLSEVDTVVFDKTGTLTQGVFHVTKNQPAEGFTEDGLLEYAAMAESSSNHPIAVSLREAYGKQVEVTRLSDAKNYAGKGITVELDGRTVAAGNKALMELLHISCADVVEAGTVVHVSVDGTYAGYLVIADTVKPGAREALAHMKAAGVRRTIMLTGDNKVMAEKVAGELGLDSYHAELLPQDKVAEVEKLLGEQNGGRKVAFVGDGINDAPVLARADLGIAMGAMGSDAAIEAADVVLMDDNLDKIATAVHISRKTLRIVHENIVFALGIKLLILLLAAIGKASMWLAAFGDVGVAVIAILNAMRALKAPKEQIRNKKQNQKS
ncbi:MAG: heavy metal translocating P-type ATPase [Lachnospiraceae bacterium]|nr:heavy metal translocating P-type ATPase [Lachnospiraceae bacterium]